MLYSFISNRGNYYYLLKGRGPTLMLFGTNLLSKFWSTLSACCIIPCLKWD